MCDRGSNFRKAFKSFQPLFCFGHRLNNVLKRAFFQHLKKTSSLDHPLFSVDGSFTTAITSSSSAIQPAEEIFTDDSEMSSEDDCESTAAIPIARKRKDKARSSSKSSRVHTDLQPAHMKMTIDQVPSSAKQVLRTLHQCKRVVKYAKKVSEREVVIDLLNTVLLLFVSFES